MVKSQILKTSNSEVVVSWKDNSKSVEDFVHEIKGLTEISVATFLSYCEFLEGAEENWDFSFAVELALLCRRATPIGIDESSKAVEFLRVLTEFYTRWIKKCSYKTKRLTFNREVNDLLHRLIGVGAIQWTESDIQTILFLFEGVYAVDCRNLEMSSLKVYNLFLGELAKRYEVDLKLKYLLDPHLVVVDLPPSESGAFNQIMKGLVDDIELYVPVPDNVCAKPFAWSFSTADQALHFIKVLKGAIPDLCLLYYQTLGPVAVY
jgi:hypothetical protein